MLVNSIWSVPLKNLCLVGHVAQTPDPTPLSQQEMLHPTSRHENISLPSNMWSSYYYCDQNPMRRFTKALCSKHATCEALLQLQQPVVFSGFDLEWTKMQQNNPSALWCAAVHSLSSKLRLRPDTKSTRTSGQDLINPAQTVYIILHVINRGWHNWRWTLNQRIRVHVGFSNYPSSWSALISDCDRWPLCQAKTNCPAQKSMHIKLYNSCMSSL